MELEKLKKLINKNEKLLSQNEIVAVYIFGSRAGKKYNTISDYDFAVLLNEEILTGSYFEKKLELLEIFTNILKTDNVDLVILNEAPVEIAYRVFAKGKLLYENIKYRNHRVRFQAKTYSMYFDFLPIKKVQSKGLKKRLEEGYYGGR